MRFVDLQLCLPVYKVFVAFNSVLICHVAGFGDEWMVANVCLAGLVVGDFWVNRCNVYEDMHPIGVFIGHHNEKVQIGA